MQTLEEQFNTRLNAFLGSTGLRPTTLGMQALGDPNLMRQIEGGRSMSLRTADRVSGVHRRLRRGLGWPAGAAAVAIGTGRLRHARRERGGSER